jgi:hypothetical protein
MFRLIKENIKVEKPYKRKVKHNNIKIQSLKKKVSQLGKTSEHQKRIVVSMYCRRT